MLRSCSEKEFENYIDLMYGLALDLTKSGYPTYCDGIKTKADFAERSHQAFERDTEQILLFEQEGAVRGMIHYFLIPEDHYLQTICFNIDNAMEQAISEFLAYVGERFQGYGALFTFPAENSLAVNYLAEHGFECIEDDYNNTAFFDKFDEIQGNSDLIRIEKQNFEKFESLHCQTEGYWNSERILADLDNWIILVKEKDGKPQGAVYYSRIGDGWFEIYGIDMKKEANHAELFKELLTAALFDAKHKKGRFMTFFCEKECEKIAMECGFICIGNTLCYKIRLGS